MGKKKEKATESKKTSDKTEKETTGGSFLDNLRPTTGKPENTRGTGKTSVTNTPTPTMNDKTKKVVAGGILAVAIGALALVGFNMTSSSEQAQVENPAPAMVMEQPARAASEAAAASMLPQPLAPQKARLAEPSKPAQELAKPSKTATKKSGKLATKAKTKDSVKKSVASTKKQKAAKKSKKTLAAKSN
ncbi:MAG: hypothetical protein M3Q07_07360 [Pseudobdellovibrionaceae bacterium]|nr:hypothetical protein [Pseudobdellovibrionaceae bacterium]